MVEHGFPSSADALSMLFDLCYRSGRTAEAINFFAKLVEGDQSASELNVYNHAINAYKSMGRLDDALSVMKEIRKHDLKPNMGTYAQLINICQITARGDEALAWLHQ